MDVVAAGRTAYATAKEQGAGASGQAGMPEQQADQLADIAKGGAGAAALQVRTWSATADRCAGLLRKAAAAPGPLSPDYTGHEIDDAAICEAKLDQAVGR